jgi:hypothetical protein
MTTEIVKTIVQGIVTIVIVLAVFTDVFHKDEKN